MASPEDSVVEKKSPAAVSDNDQSDTKSERLGETDLGTYVQYTRMFLNRC